MCTPAPRVRLLVSLTSDRVLAEAGLRWSGGRLFASVQVRRVTPVQGCEGIGKHVVLRQLEAGEMVVDVPGKLSAWMRVYATGNAGGLRNPGLARWRLGAWCRRGGGRGVGWAAKSRRRQD